MLAIPQKNFQRSVDSINIGTGELGDWVEGSLLFRDGELSKSEVVSTLGDEKICPKQDLAHEIVDIAWEEIRRRKKYALLPDTLILGRDRMEDVPDWRDDVVRAFFITLSVFRLFPDWAKANRDSTTQGALFERIVEAICPNIFPRWTVYRTGWSPETPYSLSEVVQDLCDRMNYTGAPDLDDWATKNAKDGGLDIVCFMDFCDDREALPAYFIQCASGSDWRQKLDTPNSELWGKWLNSAVRPSSGIAAPFIIDSKTLRISSLSGQVMVLDRLRLLRSFYIDDSVLTNELRKSIVEWLEPRIATIPSIT